MFENGVYANDEAAAQNGMDQIGLLFLKVFDAVKFGGGRAAKPRKLWEPKPLPMGGFSTRS